MPQLSLYLDEPTMEKLRTDASSAGTTLSSYVRDVLGNHDKASLWPAKFFDLYGAADDPSFTAPAELAWDATSAVDALE